MEKREFKPDVVVNVIASSGSVIAHNVPAQVLMNADDQFLLGYNQLFADRNENFSWEWRKADEIKMTFQEWSELNN